MFKNFNYIYDPSNASIFHNPHINKLSNHGTDRILVENEPDKAHKQFKFLKRNHSSLPNTTLLMQYSKNAQGKSKVLSYIKKSKIKEEITSDCENEKELNLSQI